MNNEVIDFPNLIIAALSAIASWFTLWIAWRALDQISQQKEQNLLTRETVAIAELRHFEYFLVEYENLIRLIKSRNPDNIGLCGIEMNEFNLSEAGSDKFKDKISLWHKFYTKHDDIYLSAIRCANSLEVISTALEHGTAKLSVIENAISPALCNFVELNAYVYIRNRNASINLFLNTINLYNKLKHKVGTINSQIDKIESEVKKIFGEKLAKV